METRLGARGPGKAAAVAILSVLLTLAASRIGPWHVAASLCGAVTAVALVQVAPPLLVAIVPAATLACLAAARTPTAAAMTAVLGTQVSGIAMGLLVRQGMPPLVAIVGGALPSLLPDLLRVASTHGAGLLRPDPGEVDRSVAATLDFYRWLNVSDERLSRLGEILRAGSTFLISIAPALQLLGILAVFFLVYLVCRALLTRVGIEIRPVERFSLWKLSHWYVWFFAAGLFAVLLPGEPAQVAGRNLVVVMVAAYLIQGLSVTQFLMIRRGLGPFVRLLVYGMGILAVFPFFAAMTTGIGLFDTWFDFRRLEPRPEPEATETDRHDE